MLYCFFRSAALIYGSIKAAIRLNPFPRTLKSLHSDSPYLSKVGCIRDEVLAQKGLSFISSNVASKAIDDLYLLLLFPMLASPIDLRQMVAQCLELHCRNNATSFCRKLYPSALVWLAIVDDSGTPFSRDHVRRYSFSCTF